MRIGSLFSGYGGLEAGVQLAIGGTVAWHSEVDPAANRILTHHWPDVPNLGDVTTVDWAAVEPVDVITGGSPCQDVSHAGKRAGMRAGTRSGLWAAMTDAIDYLRPALVVWENVRGVLSAGADSDLEPCPWCMGDESVPDLRALGRVLGDLADLGYDTAWHGLRAADVGAPHGRFRVFVVAADARGEAVRLGTGLRTSEPDRLRWGRPDHDDPPGADAYPDIPRWQGGEPAARRHLSARRADADPTGDGRHERRPEPARLQRGHDAAVSGAVAADTDSTGQRSVGRVESIGRDSDRRRGADITRRKHEPATPDPTGLGATSTGGSMGAPWGRYAAAIRRWEHTLGRTAPAPTEPGRTGQPRLSPAFVEWLMGLPAGHVTDVPGVTRNDQLKVLGNGVVPQQAAAAVAICLRMLTALEEAAA